MEKFLQGNKGASPISVVIWLVIIIGVITVGFLILNTEDGSVNDAQESMVGEAEEVVDMEEGTEEVVEHEELDEEKEEIIQAILNTDSILRSGDVEMIREHVAIIDPGFIEDVSDEEILEVSEFYLAFAAEVNANDFRGDNVTWNITEESAIVSIDQNGTTDTYEATKIDGVWY